MAQKAFMNWQNLFTNRWFLGLDNYRTFWVLRYRIGVKVLSIQDDNLKILLNRWEVMMVEFIEAELTGKEMKIIPSE